MRYHARRQLASAIALLIGLTMPRFLHLELYVAIPAVIVVSTVVFWLFRVFPGVHKE